MTPSVPPHAVVDAPPLISRFSIALVSCVLMGMSLGVRLPEGLELLSGSAGVIGLGFYGYRTRAVRHERERHTDAVKARVECRLDTLVSETHALPSPHVVREWIRPIGAGDPIDRIVF